MKTTCDGPDCDNAYNEEHDCFVEAGTVDSTPIRTDQSIHFHAAGRRGFMGELLGFCSWYCLAAYSAGQCGDFVLLSDDGDIVCPSRIDDEWAANLRESLLHRD